MLLKGSHGLRHIKKSFANIERFIKKTISCRNIHFMLSMSLVDVLAYQCNFHYIVGCRLNATKYNTILYTSLAVIESEYKSGL